MTSRLAAATLVLLVSPAAFGQTAAQDGWAPPPAVESPAAAPSASTTEPSQAPPPPQIQIPGVDIPAPAAPATTAPAASTPAPAATPAPTEVAPPPPPDPASGPVFVPAATRRQKLEPRIQRGGGYFGFGGGFGLANFAEKSFAGSGAGVFGLRFGKIVGDQLMFGPEIALTGQFDAWAENRMVGAGISSIMGQLMYFPFAAIPFNVAGGAGWGSGLQISRLNEAEGDVPVVAEGHDGVSWMAGLGWDFFAGPGWNLGLQLRHDGVHFEDSPDVAGYTFQVWLNSY